MSNDFFDGDFEFEDTIKKAKRMSMIRTVMISAFIFGILSALLYFVNMKVVESIEKEQEEYLRAYYSIKRPNEYIGSIKFTPGIFESGVDYTTYKIIDKKPVFAGGYSFRSGAFAKSDPMDGYMRNTIFMGVDKGTGGMMEYGPTGFRKMRLYHYKADYYREPNEIAEMDGIGPDEDIEAAISFNRALSFEDARRVVPKNLDIAWYWIDTFEGEKLKEHQKFAKSGKWDYISADHAVGIEGMNRFGEAVGFDEEMTFSEVLEQDFETSYEEGMGLNHIDRREFEEIGNDLGLERSSGESDRKLEVIGVVVTGKAEDIKSFSGDENIKASVIGYR